MPLPWPRIQSILHHGQFFVRYLPEVGAFREILPQETVCIFICATFRGAVRVGEEAVDAELARKFKTLCEQDQR